MLRCRFGYCFSRHPSLLAAASVTVCRAPSPARSLLFVQHRRLLPPSLWGRHLTYLDFFCPVQVNSTFLPPQRVDKKFVGPGKAVVFDGIPVGDTVREMLFSLPRFVTKEEKLVSSGALSL